MGYAFISYSSAQQRQLEQVKEYLRANSISFWSAPDDIPIGTKYSEVIKRAIADASCVLFLLSDRSQNSTYCKLEIALALKMEKTVIPIQLEDVILNDDFSLYLSRSEIFPLPGKFTTARTHKLLSQLRLLCAEPGQSDGEQDDPSYKIGWFRKGTWLQIFGWLWVSIGYLPFSAFAQICFPRPPFYTGGNHPVDQYNGPLIETNGFKGGILVTALMLIGLLMLCYGFSLNRKKLGKERLFFRQFSICQILLILSCACWGISMPLITLWIEHYRTPLVSFCNTLWEISLMLFQLTAVVWLFRRTVQLYRWLKNRRKS